MRAKDDLAAAATPSDLAAPEFTATVFGAAEVKARLYADLLTTAGVERGLLGPQEASRVWSRHLFNCAAAAEFVPEVGSVADLGSGAGLPGVVLSLLRPQTDVLLIEPKLRRADFLHEVVGNVGRRKVIASTTHSRGDLPLRRACHGQPRNNPITSGRFSANAAWLALGVMAHNLGGGVGILAGGQERRATAATLRHRLFAVPGRLVSSGRRLTYGYPRIHVRHLGRQDYGDSAALLSAVPAHPTAPSTWRSRQTGSAAVPRVQLRSTSCHLARK